MKYLEIILKVFLKFLFNSFYMEDNKRFINLTTSYKDFFNNINNDLQHVTIKLDFKKLDKIHKKIEQEAILNNLHNNDLNRLLLYCDNSSPILKSLKNFVILRNVRFLEKVIKDVKYKEFINKLVNNIKNTSINQVEKALTTIWNKYLEYWNGNWHFIDYSNGKIKSIEILDPEEYKNLIAQINLYKN